MQSVCRFGGRCGVGLVDGLAGHYRLENAVARISPGLVLSGSRSRITRLEVFVAISLVVAEDASVGHYGIVHLFGCGGSHATRNRTADAGLNVAEIATKLGLIVVGR